MTTTDTRHSTLDARHSAFGVRRSSPAFTLIEMLIVISVISVLLGLLYGSLERARKFSRRAVAYTEVKNIEAAFKQYYAHYHDWPPESFLNSVTALTPQSAEGDNGFVIDASAAKMLQGDLSETDDQTLRSANPDRIPFIEFARRNAQNIPINPFRLSSGTTETRQYKVLFDLNNDSQLQISDSIVSSFQTNVYASVAVWTVIPGTSSSGQNNNGTQSVTDEVLGSWDTFGAK